MLRETISRRQWMLQSSGALALALTTTHAEAQEYRIKGSDIKLGVAS